MGAIVNLNRHRKRRACAAAELRAAANRMKHGRTGAAKATDRQAVERRRAALDGVKLDRTDGAPPGR
jgi:hypothetical protein